jgi:hypothetical protein
MKDLAFATNYRSGANDLVDELFALALSKSTSYRRAAGFFSSSVFQVLSPSLQGLFSRAGSMTLVTSPKLSRDDIEAIGEFYVRRSAQHASRTLAALFGDFVAKRLSSPALFGELLRRGHLRVFIARPRTAPVPAIYHEKFAILACGAERNRKPV